MQKFRINGRLVGLNEYITACRTNPHVGAKMKKTEQNKVRAAIRDSGIDAVEAYPVAVEFTWYEKDRRRDIDNIAFAKKFIMDALVAEGILEDDSQKYVCRVADTFEVDRVSPHIEVRIRDYTIPGGITL